MAWYTNALAYYSEIFINALKIFMVHTLVCLISLSVVYFTACLTPETSHVKYHLFSLLDRTCVIKILTAVINGSSKTVTIAQDRMVPCSVMDPVTACFVKVVIYGRTLRP